MESSTFIGNCGNIIDWANFTEQLLLQSASTVGPMFGTGYEKEYQPDTIANSKMFNETIEIWKNAGYRSTGNGGSAEWHMFYPGVNFEQSIVDQFVEFYNIDRFTQCWVSMILPGKCAPWHVDQYDVQDNITRYHCHIGTPEMGHVFMIENDYYVGCKQGDAYRWNDQHAWHAGFNAGRTPKFTFNLY